MKWLSSLFAATVAVSSYDTAQAAKRPLFIYLNTSFKSWADPCLDIKYMIDQGATEVLLSFWLNTGNADAAIAWEWMTAAQRTECLDYAHSHGAKILLAAGGATDFPYDVTTGTDYGTRAAQQTLDFGLDGLDFDLEMLPPHFGDSKHYQWLIDCSKAARNVFDQGSEDHKIITHAPQGPYFTSWAGSNLGYVQLMKDLGHVVDYYLIQYYNQASCAYLEYSSIFTATEAGCWSPGATILEIKKALGPADEHLWTKLVVGKPATLPDVVNTGFVAPADLAAISCKAEADDGYVGGIMAWSYRGMDFAEMNTFWAAVAGESCGAGGNAPAPTAAPPAPTAAPPAPTAAPPAPTAAPPAPTAAPPAQTAAPPAPTAAPPAQTAAPPAGTMNCFHNKEHVWWTSECADADACMYGSAYTTEAACIASGMPYAVWSASADACRKELLSRGGCSTAAAGGAPVATPPSSPDAKACYHNSANFWWASDCNSADICVFDGAYLTEAECTASAYPHAYFGTEAECRTYVQSKAGCTA